MPLVFQYGSNTSSARINSDARLQGTARDLGLALTEASYDLVFTYHCRNSDCAAADLQERGGRQCYGVLYDIPDERVFRSPSGTVRTLDDIECEGAAYIRTAISVFPAEGEIKAVGAITYIVRDPRPDLVTGLAFVSHIVTGLREHGAPQEYIDYVKAQALRSNPDLVATLASL